MTKRATSLRYPESVVKDGRIGTAKLREWARQPMTAAQLAIFKMNGNPPQTSALDDSDDPFAAPVRFIGKSKKSPKYRNTRCEHDGIKFDSLKERSRWVELLGSVARGEIGDLRRQVPFILAEATVIRGKKKRARKYIADFVYVTVDGDEQVVEDVKGYRTAMYEFKRHLMKTVHGIEISEITK